MYNSICDVSIDVLEWGKMKLSRETCTRAMNAKDAKFDGKFYIGVHSTGIYCRPICPAPTPKLKNIQFYPSAASASDAGLRPCLRCKPEIAPGIDWLNAPTTLSKALKLISNKFPYEIKITDLAERLELSSRHLRRIFQEHLGTTPFSIWNTKKIHFAKHLIDKTSLSFTEIAFASGFNSIRSFNNTFKKTYQKSPTELRKNKIRREQDPSVTLYLTYREPFNWSALLGFLALRAIPGVEQVVSGSYRRIIQIEDQTGIISVGPGEKMKSNLKVKIIFPRLDKLYIISEKVKTLFDLESPANEIDAFLIKDNLLKKSVQENKGIRVPGCWDPFELTIRAILGQQISVKGATTISGRIVEKFGQKYCGPGFQEESLKQWFTFPGPEILKDGNFEGLGLTNSRINTIKSVSAVFCNNGIDFEHNMNNENIINQLKAVKGIGDWTAQYIAMRALRDPNAFPASDLGLIKAVSTDNDRMKPNALNRLSQNWTPWRATAAMYLWRKL